MDTAGIRVYSEKEQRQINNEQDGFEKGIKRYNDRRVDVLENQNKDNTALSPEAIMMSQYMSKAVVGVQQAIRSRVGDAKRRLAVKVFSGMVNAGYTVDRLTFLAMRSCFNVNVDQPLQATWIKLGKVIEDDYEYLQFEQQAPGYLSKMEENLRSTHLRHRDNVIQAARKTLGLADVDWSEEIRLTIGQILIEAVVVSTGLFEIVDMVRSGYKLHNPKSNTRKKPYKILRPTAVCLKFTEKANGKFQVMHPFTYPMIVPPKKWDGVKGGGFLSPRMGLKAKMIRSRGMDNMIVATKHGVAKVNEALNLIQETPFIINRPLFKVIKKAVKRGMGKLPAPVLADLLPPKFWLTGDKDRDNAEFEKMKAEGDPRLIEWKLKRTEAYDRWHRETSKRIAIEQKINVAGRFIDEPELYWVWSIDYRGRAYPRQTWLSPQEDDAGRALLLYKNGKRIGSDGAYWLAVHGANCFGVDKIPFDERVQWIHKHEELIKAVAEDAFSCRWWEGADKPYLFLAFCYEYAGFLRDGYDFITHLPVQVDGTCSGLQHFSALLRDEQGGSSVNLIKGAKPADVYAEVAKVSTRILNDKVKGGDDEEGFAALWLKLGVSRSVVKRNVMTIPYGATVEGFSNQLIAYSLKESLDFGDCNRKQVCRFLANVNWTAVQEVLVKSMEAMKYLQQVARFIGMNQLTLQWTTPVGLRVLQDVRKTKTKQINTKFGGIRYQLSIQHDTKKVDTVGHKNKVAPNFIHSMDASHLMLTVLRCADNGITDFSVIHDSFGCHACDMPTLNRILRETFVEMYSEDWLAKFTADVRENQIPTEKLREKFDAVVAEFKPAFGKLDVSAVIDSPYFFG